MEIPFEELLDRVDISNMWTKGVKSNNVRRWYWEDDFVVWSLIMWSLLGIVKSSKRVRWWRTEGWGGKFLDIPDSTLDPSSIKSNHRGIKTMSVERTCVTFWLIDSNSYWKVVSLSFGEPEEKKRVVVPSKYFKEWSGSRLCVGVRRECWKESQKKWPKN